MNELLQKLNTARRICGEIDRHYTELNELQQRRDKKEDVTDGIAKFVAVVGLSTICLCVALPILLKAPDVILLAAGIALLLLWVVSFFIIWHKAKIAVKKTTDRLNGEIAEHQAAAQRLYSDNRESIAFLPSDYQYPIAIDYLIKMIQTGRAATLPEALDKYDEQVHRWKLEEASNQMLALQQQQAAQLANIRRNTSISAAADVISAAVSISNSR